MKKTTQYSAVDLGFGFKATKNLPPSLEVLSDDGAYKEAAARDQLAYRFDDEKVPQVDFDQHVVLVYERGDEGGMDVRPVVNDVTRDGDVLAFDLGFAALPDAEGLDVQRRPYLYFLLPKEAVAGDPQLELTVDGHSVP